MNAKTALPFFTASFLSASEEVSAALIRSKASEAGNASVGSDQRLLTEFRKTGLTVLKRHGGGSEVWIILMKLADVEVVEVTVRLLLGVNQNELKG